MERKQVILFVLAAFSLSAALAANQGHVECEKQFKKLSNGLVTGVPEVRDWGGSREYYFAWNSGSKSKLIKTKNGGATGSCVINKRTGAGFVTLNSKDLGAFNTYVDK